MIESEQSMKQILLRQQSLSRAIAYNLHIGYDQLYSRLLWVILNNVSVSFDRCKRIHDLERCLISTQSTIHLLSRQLSAKYSLTSVSSHTMKVWFHIIVCN